MKSNVIIPEWVTEQQLPQLLQRLHAANEAEEIAVDISGVKFLIPAAVVAILARCHCWKKQQKRLRLLGLDRCPAASYLQRMDFLHHLGVQVPDSINRLPSEGRFVPVQTLTYSVGSVESISSEITQCILPSSTYDDDEYQLIQYAAGELLSNAKYHSAGRAFVSAQYFPKRNWVSIAVADDGVGIRQKFIGTSRETDAANADAAIQLALTPGVSSALLAPEGPYSTRNHRGVGLSLTRELVKGANGHLLIATEDGWLSEDYGKIAPFVPRSIYGQGTIVAATFHCDHIANYAAMRMKAMDDIGMFSETASAIFLD